MRPSNANTLPWKRERRTLGICVPLRTASSLPVPWYVGVVLATGVAEAMRTRRTRMQRCLVAPATKHGNSLCSKGITDARKMAGLAILLTSSVPLSQSLLSSHALDIATLDEQTPHSSITHPLWLTLPHSTTPTQRLSSATRQSDLYAVRQSVSLSHRILLIYVHFVQMAKPIEECTLTTHICGANWVSALSYNCTYPSL